MRDMTSTELCTACSESVWLRFLARMSLIDAVRVDVDSANPTTGLVAVVLEVVPVAQFRPGGPINNERYILNWEHNGMFFLNINLFPRFKKKTGTVLLFFFSSEC